MRDSITKTYDDKVGQYVVGALSLAGPAFVALAVSQAFPHPDAAFRYLFPVLLLVINLALYALVRKPTERRNERGNLLLAGLAFIRLVVLLI